MISLPDLLEEDGHELVRKGKDIKVSCPFHDEKTPSCSVFVGTKGKWVYYCHGCGASGDDVAYLVDYRKMDMREALKMRDGKDFTASSKPVAKKKQLARATSEPVPIARLPDNHVARYEYFFANGTPAFTVQRYESDDGKFFGQYTPSNGKWLKGMKVPNNRPLYFLPEVLKADAKKQVMIVEGEKCADAVKKSFPSTVVCTWACGTSSIHLTDWSPLEGRPLMLVADSNPQGYLAMAEIARKMAPVCPRIVLVLPRLTWKGSRDIADFIDEDRKKVAKWVAQAAQKWGPELDRKMKNLSTRFQKRMTASRRKKDAARKLQDRVTVENRDGVLRIKVGDQAVHVPADRVLSSVPVLLSICPDRGFWDKVTSMSPTRENASKIADMLLQRTRQRGK